MKQEIIDYIDSNAELSTYVTSLAKMNELINNDVARLFMLASIISSDAIYDLKSAQEAQERLNFIVNNMKFFNVTDNIRTEIDKFSADAQEIITKEIKKYSRKKRTSKRKSDGDVYDYMG